MEASDLTVTAKTVGLVINAPNVFERDDFLEWLNDDTKRKFTWHTPGALAHDYSDVMVLVDSNYEGPDSDMPEDIWRAICDVVYGTYCDGRPNISHLGSHVTVRLTNLDD